MPDKIKYPELTSPKGTFIWPTFSEPDPKYSRYGTKFAFPGNTEEAKAFIATIDAEYDKSPEQSGAIEALNDAIKKAGKTRPLANTPGIDVAKLPAIAPKMAPKPYSVELDDQGNETGRILISTGMKDSYTKKLSKEVVALTPRLFDATGKALDHKKVKVRGGSEGRVRVELRPYFVPAAAGCGVSLAFKGAQITKLSSGGASAASMGFGVEEDGFVYEEPATATESPAAGAANGGSAEPAASKGNF